MSGLGKPPRLVLSFVPTPLLSLFPAGKYPTSKTSFWLPCRRLRYRRDNVSSCCQSCHLPSSTVLLPVVGAGGAAHHSYCPQPDGKRNDTRHRYKRRTRATFSSPEPPVTSASVYRLPCDLNHLKVYSRHEAPALSRYRPFHRSLPSCHDDVRTAPAGQRGCFVGIGEDVDIASCRRCRHDARATICASD